MFSPYFLETPKSMFSICWLFCNGIFRRGVPCGMLVLFDMFLPKPTNQIMAEHQLTWAKAVVCMSCFKTFQVGEMWWFDQTYCWWKRFSQPVNVENLLSVWCIRVSSIKCDEFDRRIHAGTLGSTALPPIPVVVCILAIAIAPEIFDDATGLNLTWESVVFFSFTGWLD